MLVLLITQHLFQSNWSWLFDINQPFSQTWSQKVSKANLCSKTVGTIFALSAFHSTSFPIIWLLLFDVNQLFSQKWSLKLLKANFCSKTVGTVFAVFVLHSTSFQINLVIIVWCQSIIFSEMKPGALKSKLLLEDSGHSICCFLFFFQHLSQSIWLLLFVLNQFFLRNRVRNS